jgi:hypothetical protein
MLLLHSEKDLMIFRKKQTLNRNDTHTILTKPYPKNIFFCISGKYRSLPKDAWGKNKDISRKNMSLVLKFFASSSSKSVCCNVSCFKLYVRQKFTQNPTFATHGKESVTHFLEGTQGIGGSI